MFLTAVEYDHTGFVDSISTVFGNIWDGLSSIYIPGTNWPIADFFIAIMTAGLILKIFKHLFADVVGNNSTGFGSGHRRSESRKED